MNHETGMPRKAEKHNCCYGYTNTSVEHQSKGIEKKECQLSDTDNTEATLPI